MKCLVKIISILLLINNTLSFGIFNFKNNACSTNTAYFFQFLKSNTKCHYQKEVYIEMPKRIELMVGKYGETHTVTTEDGYILQNFRLRHPNPNGVILINPPYTSDSRIWLLQGNNSLGFIFWQLGYDVWLSNYRGTDYSYNHVTLNTSSSKFWDFSFHEIGVYDLKSTVDYIYNVTGMKLVMIGHSMSTTTSLIYASMHPEEAAEKVSVIVAISLSAYLNNVRGMLPRVFGPFRKIIQALFDRRGYTHHLQKNDKWNNIRKITYHFFPFKFLLPKIFSLFFGNTARFFDPIFLGTFITSTSGQSIKPLYHYAQIWHRKKFAMYDYGSKKNKIIYGQKTPTDYPIEKIKVPIHVVVSTNDYLSTVKDADLVYARLRQEAKVYGMRVISDINHYDPHFSFLRMAKVWNPIIDLINTVSYQQLM